MPALANSKHDQFAQLVAKGVSATEAYVSAGYSKAGAAANSSRLITNDKVSARIKELQEAVAAGVIDVEIRKRSVRVQVLQEQLNRMRRLIDERAIEYADYPAGATGMLVKDYRGKDANQVVWKFDGALVAQIAGVMKQAAIEEGQWTEKRELSASVGLSQLKARINAGRDRLVAEKKAALARGEVWR